MLLPFTAMLLSLQTECATYFGEAKYVDAAAVCASSTDPAEQLLGARSLVLLKRHRAAIPLYVKVRESHRGANIAQELADCYLLTNQPGQAADVLDSVRDADTPKLHRQRVIAHRGAAMEIAAGLTDGGASKHSLQGLFAFEAGRYREAFHHYRRALALAPDFPAAHAAISEIYHRTGHPDWAEIEVQLEKNRPPQGPLKAALDHLQAAQAAEFRLSQLPPSWESLDVQAQAAKRQAKYSRATKLYADALRLSPGNPILEREMALCLVLAKRPAEAIHLLRKYEMSLELCRAYVDLEEWQKALPLAVAPSMDRQVEAALLRGRITIELNRPQEALPYLQALAKYDTDGSVHEMLGRAYQALHLPNPAGLALVKARELRKKSREGADAEITPPAEN